MSNDTTVIIFSKNRPMQLDLCLNSFYLHLDNVDLPSTNVIYKADEEYKSAYETLKSEHENVLFIEEQDFRTDLLNLLQDKRYVLFVVDDTIFTGRFDLDQIIALIYGNPQVLGFSLRLGLNTKYCYPYNAFQDLPNIYEKFGEILRFIWLSAPYDFGYPLEVSSSVYRTEDILQIIKNENFTNPNSLEALLYQYSWSFSVKPYMLSYAKSVAFASPLNKVQNEAKNNRSGQSVLYAPEHLLNLYNSGLRVDYERFSGFTPNAAHQEVDFTFIEREK